ncbi:MAG: hypothetical protein GMKNLPBB_00700 [Myxococcota bacterium]|nr:hypothetical protein [Myxococcota bacterium]
MERVTKLLREHHIQPSAQRVAVGGYVLFTEEHPSAEQVWERVKENFPWLSRATVYNTLNLFVKKGLIRELIITEGKSVFDPRLDPHHHFVDEESGDILDIPFDTLEVRRLKDLPGLDIHETQVIIRGRRSAAPAGV